jgi:hypothetical protein
MLTIEEALGLTDPDLMQKEIDKRRALLKKNGRYAFPGQNTRRDRIIKG